MKEKELKLGYVWCNTCDGTGEVRYSCCGGDIITGDYLVCPQCRENLGLETCEECNGSGQVKAEDQTNPDKIDLQARAEALRDLQAENA